MARRKKKLNKKVAIIGSILLAGFLLIAIVAILHFMKDPDKFLADAQAALTEAQAALAADDGETAEQAYANVERNFKEAFGCTKNENLKIDILFTIQSFFIP